MKICFIFIFVAVEQVMTLGTPFHSIYTHPAANEPCDGECLVFEMREDLRVDRCFHLFFFEFYFVRYFSRSVILSNNFSLRDFPPATVCKKLCISTPCSK